MKIIINNNEMNLTASALKSLDQTITLIHGRRFSYQSKETNGFRMFRSMI